MWIEFGIINYKLILPFVYPFFFQIRKFIHKNDKRAFYEFFTNYLGYLSQGIVYLIILKRTQKRRESLASIDLDTSPKSAVELKHIKEKETPLIKTNTNTKKVKYFQNPTSSTFNLIEIEKEKRNSRLTKEKYLYLFLLACIYLIPMFLDSYCSSDKSINFNTSSSISLFFCIISYVTLSRIILGDKVYRHQFFSLIIIIICNILSIILILIWAEDNSNLAINILIMAVIMIFFAVFNVVEKRYFNKYMDSPYHYMFVVGLISTIIILLYETITVLAASKDEVYNGIFLQIEKNFSESNLYPLVLLGDLVSAFFWVMGIHLTVYYFSPCHFIISEAISQILSTFINPDNLVGRPLAIKIIIYVLFFIIFFASLIYNEVIIITVFDLNKNTKKFIEERAQFEKDLNINDDEQIENNKNILNEENDPQVYKY